MIENMFLTFLALFIFSVVWKSFTFLDFGDSKEDVIVGAAYIVSAHGSVISALMWIWS